MKKIKLKNLTKEILQKGHLKDFFDNDEEFKEALDDALIIQKLKTPTKFSINLEDIEEKLKKITNLKDNFAFNVLLVNYKRYLYKHILEIEKMSNIN